MAWQSSLEQFKSARVSRNSLLALGIGVGIGLVLGIMVGWVWWPVEWQSATLSDMSLSSKATYMAAVADAFAADRSPEAGALAAGRLAPLGDSLPQDFEDALTYYAGQPDARVRSINLAMLASALGVPVDLGGIAAAATAATADATATVLAAPVEQSPAADDNGGGGWGAWLAVALAAIVLFGGGAYILWLVAIRPRMTGSAGEPAHDGFIDEDLASPGPATPAFDRASLSPSFRPVTPGSVGATAYGASAAQTARPSAAATEYGFEEDEEDELANPTTGAVAIGGFGAQRVATADDDREVEEEDPDEDWPTRMPDSTLLQSDLDEDESVADEAEDGLPADASDTLAKPTASSRETSPTTNSAPPNWSTTRYDRYPVLDQHMASFQVGVSDFDHTHNVTNPTGSGYIGEYGIGIADRHGLLNNNLEQVVALELYLFDKSDENQMVTTTRSLLSEYAHDKLYAIFDREKQSADPITAQKGTRFQLEGRQLILDCLVKDVRYTREGIFQSVTVDMVLRRRS